ncbi:helix-turn-helix domain-containing protein [Faecalibacillus intestinalis]|uniref:helix-turn-helix domain-containing protein n=2 Tax=Faecalibacillus intestinalis TaxID=1982626 RepID=UPI00210B1CAB|nr:helix-turn-helix domain-containing protein [Faecalibacillus intestinalis]
MMNKRMKDYMTLGERIQKYRKMKGLSQEELHISRQTISKWESNQSSPDIQSCKAMADVFGISLEELLDERKK